MRTQRHGIECDGIYCFIAIILTRYSNSMLIAFVVAASEGCRHPRHGQIRIYADSMCNACKQLRFDNFISYVSLILFTCLLQRLCSTCHNVSLHCNLCMTVTDGASLEFFQVQVEPRRKGKKTIKAPLLKAEKNTISSISTSIETDTLVDVQGKAVGTGTDLDAIVGNAAHGNATGNSHMIKKILLLVVVVCGLGLSLGASFEEIDKKILANSRKNFKLVATTASLGTVGFGVLQQYIASSTCSGTISSGLVIGTGTCYSEDGVTSAANIVGDTSGNAISITKNTYSDAACTTLDTTTVDSGSTTCVGGGGASEIGFFSTSLPSLSSTFGAGTFDG